MAVKPITVSRLEASDPMFPRSFAIRRCRRYDSAEILAYIESLKAATAEVAMNRARLTGGEVPDEELPAWARSDRPRATRGHGRAA